MPDEKKTEDYEAEISALNEQIGDLRKEAAKYRLARNEALRQGHVLKTIAKAHNIKADLSEMDYSSLNIEDGKVVGEFEYSPKKISQKELPNIQQGETGLTLEKIQSMSAADIEKNYDAVMEVMANTRG